MSDNGSAYKSRLFADAIAAHALRHIRTHHYTLKTTDEIEQPFSCSDLLISPGPRTTARHRAGREVRALPRSHHRRSYFAAPVGARRPRFDQPSVSRRYATSACSPRRFSSWRVRVRLYA